MDNPYNVWTPPPPFFSGRGRFHCVPPSPVIWPHSVPPGQHVVNTNSPTAHFWSPFYQPPPPYDPTTSVVVNHFTPRFPTQHQSSPNYGNNRGRRNNNHHQQQARTNKYHNNHNKNKRHFNPSSQDSKEYQVPQHSYQNNNNSEKQKKNKVDKNLPENNAFYCDTCDRGFKMEAFYTEHVSEHRRCHKEGCTYVAAQKLVQLHIKLHHNTGLAKKIWNLESKEDIDKWVADRKRNFPTTNNVEKKKSMTEDRIARGEVLNSKSFHHRPRESGRKRHQGYAQHLKQKKFKSDGNVMDPNSKNTDKNADSGTSTSLFPIKNSASDPVSSGLDILQKTYNSDVEDHGELNVTKNNKVSLPKNSRSSELPKLPWESKVFVRYRPTLLEKLLAKEIRHERNIILQCTRYIVENNFFENKTSVEVSEISALGSTIDVSPVELQVDGTENNSKQVFMTNTLAKTQTILRTTNLIKMPQFDETERLTESNVQGIKSEDGLVRNVRGVVAVNGLRNNVRGVTSKDSFMKDTKVSESLIGENNGVISEDGLVEGAQDVTSEDGLLEGAQDMTSEDGLLEGVQDLTSEDGLVEGAQHVTSEDGLMDGAQDVTSEDGLVENVQNVTSEDGLVEGAQDVTSGDGLGRCALDVNVEDGLGRCVPDVSFEDGLGRCAPGVTYEDGLVEGAKDVSFDDGLMESTQNVTSEDSLVGFAEDIATKDNLVGCPQGDVSEDGLVQCAMGVFYETKRTEVLQIRKNASPQSTLRIDSTENVLTDKPQNSNTSKDIHIGTPQKSNTSEDIYTGTP